MKEDEEESAPRVSNGADRAKKKKKSPKHLHIGPNARAYRVGLAFCPSCDAEKILRMTAEEKETWKVAQEALRRR